MGVPPYTYSTDLINYKSTRPVIEYVSAQDYTAAVKDANGCIAIATFREEALTCDNSDLDISIEQYGNNIQALVKGGKEPYMFALDNEEFVSDANFRNLSLGNHNITVKDVNGCIRKTNVSISNTTTYLLPNFSVSNYVYANTPIKFSNLSSNATTYSWNFGDGTTSTVENPMHIYIAAGKYIVTLSVTNGTESRTCSKSITVNVSNIVSFNPYENLVAYYPFNGNANDESSYGNNGIVNGATLSTDRFGKAQKAYYFNGIDNLIKILNNDKISTLSDNFTISYWVKSNDYSLSPICKSGYSMYGQFRLQGNSNNSISIINNGTEYSFNWSPNKEWNLFTLSFFNGTCNFYINGVLKSVSEIFQNRYTSYYDNNNDLFLGVDPWGGIEFFNGYLDDIRIYNRALLPNEVSKLYESEKPTLKSGLVAYYPFNSNAKDESGNGNNGNVNGATLTTDRFGNMGKAYSFEGVKNRIITTVKPGSISEYSITGWINTSSQNGAPFICNRGSAYSGQYSQTFLLNSAGILQYGIDYDNVNISKKSNNTVNDGNWHFFAGTWTKQSGNIVSSDIKLYIDGKLNDISSEDFGVAQSPILSPNNIVIGTYDSLGIWPYKFNGKLDDIRIYNRALSSDEITQLYNSEKPSTSNIVTDINGNVYQTVQIGTQTWMVENLKTTKFRNGDLIETTEETFYPNDLTSIYQWQYNSFNYGCYYTWYAITDNREIAPVGWHIPSYEEWETMLNYLKNNGYNYDSTIGDNKIAKSLAATTNWLTSSTQGAIGNDLSKNNSTSFTALPSGYHSYAGVFYSVGENTIWWTSSELNSEYARTWLLQYNTEKLYTNYYLKNFGFPVRCIKD